MNKIAYIVGIMALISIVACSAPSNQVSFDQGIPIIKALDQKHGTDGLSFPELDEALQGLYEGLVTYQQTNELASALDAYVDFRIYYTEAEILRREGWQWGKASTTEFGFGCRKGYARIINSSQIRNQSAITGFMAVVSLEELLSNYPNTAEQLSLSEKDLIFLNTTYTNEQKKAKGDARLMKKLCKKDED